MSKNDDFSFRWNGSHSAVIGNLGFGKQLQREAAEILYEYAFPYMPYRDGDLSLNFHIQAGETYANLVHQVWYAPYLYEGVTPKGAAISKWTTSVHPLATSEWYDYAYSMHEDQIIADIDKARLKYRSFNYE